MRNNHTWTEEPQREIWRNIRYLASAKNVHRLLSRQIASGRAVEFDDDAGTWDRSLQIAACVEQANEYQLAAGAVSYATSPLLLFYSMHSLAKACVLANVRDVSIESVRYHGLATSPPDAAADSRRGAPEGGDGAKRWCVEDERGIVNQGLFPQLCTACGVNAPPQGTSISFADVVNNIPDLAELCARHYGGQVRCFRLYDGPAISADNHFALHFSKGEDIEALLRVFPEFKEGYVSDVKHDHAPGFRSAAAVGGIPEYVRVESGALAGQYLVRGLECGLSSANMLVFCGLFILSNVVRYKPNVWMEAMDGRHSGSGAVVEAFCSLASRRLPNALLEAIWGERFTYGAPAYWA